MTTWLDVAHQGHSKSNNLPSNFEQVQINTLLKSREATRLTVAGQVLKRMQKTWSRICPTLTLSLSSRWKIPSVCHLMLLRVRFRVPLRLMSISSSSALDPSQTYANRVVHTKPLPMHQLCLAVGK